MMNYLKGIYYALLGKVEITSADYTCRPNNTEPEDAEEFFDKVASEYSEVLEVLAA